MLTHFKSKIILTLAIGLVLAGALIFVPKIKAQRATAKNARQNSIASSSLTSATTTETNTTTATNSLPPADNLSVAAPTEQQTKTATTTLVSDQTGAPDPVTIKIPSINLTAPVVKTGLETDGSLHVPSSPDQTGWYDLGPRPGEIGPSVITGHYDSAAGPGVFYNLKNVKIGDTINIIRSDGSIASFTVERLEHYSQNNFNTSAVYGLISTAGLRLITCAGTYSKITKHYFQDLVVYASLTKIIEPTAYTPL